MPTDKRIIELFKGANPVPDPERLPEAQLNADALLASGELVGADEPLQGVPRMVAGARGTLDLDKEPDAVERGARADGHVPASQCRRRGFF